MEAATPGRELVAGLIGAGVALACVLPPLVHLVTGPLGPLIGGFVAARWLRPAAPGPVLIAGTIGLCLSGLGGTAAAVVAGLEHPPSWFPALDTLIPILLGIALYGAVLGAIGVKLGSSTGRDDVRADDASSSPGNS
jgi:hypothetical protein